MVARERVFDCGMPIVDCGLWIVERGIGEGFVVRLKVEALKRCRR